MSGPDLNAKVALVTGGARGIGRACAVALAAEGAAVAVMDLNGPGAEDAAAALQPCLIREGMGGIARRGRAFRMP